MSRIQRAYQQLLAAETAQPLPAPNYIRVLGTKLDGGKLFLEWIKSISPTDVCAYSDGSSEGHGRSSWGYVLQREGKTFEKVEGFLHGCEVYDAEIIGALMALKAEIPLRKTGETFFILLDNQATVRALRTGISHSSSKETKDFYDIACKANAEVKWVPGHSKIKEMKRQIPSLVVLCDYSLLVKCSQSKFHCLICAGIYTNANKNWLTNGGQGHV